MARPEIVVVEDDAAIRETLKEVLELEGYRVSAYPDGRAALHGLQERVEPCLILLDLMMPIMNGWEFLEARKKCGDTVLQIPVVVVSAIADRKDSQNLAADGFVKKPIDIDLLLKLVSEHCAEKDQPCSDEPGEPESPKGGGARRSA